MDRYGNGEEILLHKVFESATCVPSFRHFDKELFIGDVSQYMFSFQCLKLFPGGSKIYSPLHCMKPRALGSCI